MEFGVDFSIEQLNRANTEVSSREKSFQKISFFIKQH